MVESLLDTSKGGCEVKTLNNYEDDDLGWLENDFDENYQPEEWETNHTGEEDYGDPYYPWEPFDPMEDYEWEYCDGYKPWIY